MRGGPVGQIPEVQEPSGACLMILDTGHGAREPESAWACGFMSTTLSDCVLP